MGFIPVLFDKVLSYDIQSLFPQVGPLPGQDPDTLPVLSLFTLAFAVLIFTGGFASARWYLQAGGSAADVVTLRYGVSGVLFVSYVFWCRRRLAVHPGWWKALALAATGGVPFGACIFIGVSGAPFTHGGAIVPGLALVVGSVLAWSWLGEAMGGKRIAGIVLTIAGLGLLLSCESGAADVSWWGELAYFGAGLCWATFTVLLRAFKVAPLDGAALAAVFSLPYLLIYVAFLNSQIFVVPLRETLVHGFYQGVLFNMLAVGIYAWSVKNLGAASAVAAMPLMPLYALFMEWYFFGRVPHVLVWPAMVLMAIGIVLAALAGQKTANPTNTQSGAR